MAVVNFIMNWGSVLLLGVTCFLLLISRWLSKVWRANLPPGPRPIPLLGNFHTLALGGVRNMQKILTEWGNEFGDIYTIYMAGERTIVLNSYDVIKEMFAMPVFAGRPSNFITDDISENMGIISVQGQFWKEQRRYSLSHLRDFGFGKTSFEDKILEEIDVMLGILKAQGGEAFDIQYILTNSVANNITSILWGKRYDYSDERFQGFLKSVNDNVTAINSAAVVDLVLPFVRHLPFDFIGLKKISSRVHVVEDFLREIIAEHKARLNPNSLEDFVDIYLVEIDKKANNHETTFTEKQLMKIIGDLFVAGLETTSTTLRWALLYLVIHPDIQTRLRNEVDDVIGRERTPSVRDLTNLPYMQAVLTETHRLARIASTGVPHSPLEDANFRGYIIPKGTTILPNMAAVFMDDKMYPEPEKFKPERFLDADGHFMKSASEKVIPFGIGRRVCIGESLARMELTLYMASMLQQFLFSTPEGTPTPTTVGIQGFTYMPKPFKMCVQSLN